MSIDTTSNTPTTQTSDAPEMDWDAREAQPYCRCGEVRMSQGDVLDIENGAWDRLMAWVHVHFPDAAGVSLEFADAVLDELREGGACMCEVDDDDFMRALHSIQPDAGDALALMGLPARFDHYGAGEVAVPTGMLRDLLTHVAEVGTWGAVYEGGAGVSDLIVELVRAARSVGMAARDFA